MQNNDHPLVEAMTMRKKAVPMADVFSVDLPDAQVGDEVRFVVKAVQDGKAVLEAQKMEDDSIVTTQESHSP